MSSTVAAPTPTFSIPPNIDRSTAGCSNAYPVPTDPAGWTGLVYHDLTTGECTPVRSDLTLEDPPYYGYNPAIATGAVFVALFGLLMLTHIGLWLKSRRWWLVVLPIGVFGETLGWVGRLISGTQNNYGPTSYNAFLMNIVCLTIAPAFFSGTAYGYFTILLEHAILAAGADTPQQARFNPRRLAKIFVGCDILSLVLQAAGGGIASGAQAGSDNQKTGTNIMVAGIAFQLASMLVFTVITFDYAFHLFRRPALLARLDRGWRILFWGNEVASVLIVIRGIYRTAELAEGWTGYIITHEGYFLGFDAAMMLLAVVVFAVTHIAFTLPKKHAVAVNARTPFESNKSSTAALDKEAGTPPAA